MIAWGPRRDAGRPVDIVRGSPGALRPGGAQSKGRSAI
jgi:hypothetical protein